MKAQRIRKIILEIKQLRIEQILETQTRNEREKELLQELERLTIEDCVEVSVEDKEG
jgi:hypothetical protein